MANKHIKIINGRKYYYESIRKGKKVTSRYIGPVERIRRRKKSASVAEEQLIEQNMELVPQQEQPTDENPEDSYIG